MLVFAGSVVLASGVSANVQIDFETFPDGTPVPVQTQLSDQYQAWGVVFSQIPGGSLWPGRVVAEGMYGIGSFGNSQVNVVHAGYYGQSTIISFVDLQTGEPAPTDRIHVLIGDGNPDAETFNVRVYDISGGLLFGLDGYTTHEEGYLFEYETTVPLIARIEIQLDGNSASGVAFDDLGYGTPVSAVDNSRIGSSAGLVYLDTLNPYYPGSTISLRNPGNLSIASLSIFDVAGRRVSCVPPRSGDPGVCRFVWNGLTDGGRKARSGCYLFVVQTERATVVRKVTVIR
jgi:hypothetical protein